MDIEMNNNLSDDNLDESFIEEVWADVLYLGTDGKYVPDNEHWTHYVDTEALIADLASGALVYERVLEIQGYIDIDLIYAKLGKGFFGDDAIIFNADGAYCYIYPSMDALMTPDPKSSDGTLCHRVASLPFRFLGDVEGPLDADRLFSVVWFMTVLDNEFSGCEKLDVNINYDTVEFGECDDHRCVFMSSKINPPIDKWKVDEKAITIEGWFANSEFNQPLNNWKLTKLDNIYGTFFRSKYNHPLDKWYSKPVTIYARLAFAESEFHQDLSMWKINPDSKCDGMFYKSKYTIEEVSKWGWVKDLNQPVEDLFRITDRAKDSYRWLLDAIELRFR